MKKTKVLKIIICIVLVLGILTVGRVFAINADIKNFAGQSARDAREILARYKDYFSTIIKPKPTYLGDVIPINGNGDDTND